MLVSARISPEGVPARIVQAAEEGRYELVISELLLEEVRGVLGREKFRRYFPEEAVPVYLERVRSASTRVSGSEDDTKYTEDPDDDYLVALALSSGAGVIVSGDRHLLELEGEGLPGAVRPAEFLKTLDVE